MVDWITEEFNQGHFSNRQQVENYIVRHDGKVSKGMNEALNEFFARKFQEEPRPVTPPNVLETIRGTQLPPQPEPTIEPEPTTTFIRRVFNAIRGAFQ